MTLTKYLIKSGWGVKAAIRICKPYIMCVAGTTKDESFWDENERNNGEELKEIR